MASARYTLNIDPEDLKPEPPPQRTKKQKLENWWHYHWIQLVVLAVVVLLAGYFIYQAVSRVRPDYQIALVSSLPVPQQVTDQLETGLAALGQDVNGDGDTVVQLNVYQVSFAEPDWGDAPASDVGQAMGEMTQGYTQMAESTVLTADLSAGDSTIFLLDDPEGFQTAYGALSDLEGVFPQAENSMEGVVLYDWSACPALTALDLGEYTNALGETMTGQECMSRFVVARRGFGEKQPETLAQDEALLAAMTAGAAAR